MEIRQEYLPETINYFRNLCFFQNDEYQILSDYELIELLLIKNNIYCKQFKSRFESVCHENLWYERDYITDIIIVECDRVRIIDIPTDVFSQCTIPEYSFERFCKTVDAISQISRGIFVPRQIVDIGNESVAFSVNNKHYELSPKSDCEDPLVLARQVNSIISESGYQFEMFAAPDVFVVVLTAEEKQQLAKDRQWNFVKYLQPDCDVYIR